jgi:hypothetical protein
VERQHDLVFSMRDLSDTKYQQETNHAIAQRFIDGISAKTHGCRCHRQVVTEIIPFVLWIMSAGEGSITLQRGTTSVALLNPGERLAFNRHVEVMRGLGLTYAYWNNEFRTEDRIGTGRQRDLILEPALDRLAIFVDREAFSIEQRHDIPPIVSIHLIVIQPFLKRRNLLTNFCLHNPLADEGNAGS